MTTLAAEFYRVERVSGTETLARRRLGPRVLGMALTGLPMPSSKPVFEATLRIVDASDVVVFQTVGEARSIDALELQILSDLIKLDVETFRRDYGLPDTDPDA